MDFIDYRFFAFSFSEDYYSSFTDDFRKYESAHIFSRTK
ncbi:hypothetical protein CCAN12_440019 [Capnocytophaga canimorsus]|uniref:Uncharacterized protein n=1 Tax=Capnocytophaga canimorsus TaxID=28188 RepID=A0A0B7H6P3_9FLAO|nr:hypothetical protein CCAN12_440019 [Capnocytophaga canimorsus]